MSSSQQWPLVNQSQNQTKSNSEPRVNEAERDRAERFLHQALRDGRLSVSDFEARFTAVMNAKRLTQLRDAVSDVAPIGEALLKVQDRFSGKELARPATTANQLATNAGTGTAALAHFSGLFSWIVVPAIIYGSAPRNSLTRREAAKAFNFQLVAGFGFMTVAIVLGGILGFGAPVALAWLAWLGRTVFGGIKAATGEDWQNPLNRFTRINALPTDGR